MSLSSKSYSKQSRSSSYYSRSASYQASSNNNYNYSYGSRSFADDRPLSTRLIERDSSCPSLAWYSNFDDPFYFDRLRWRFDNDFFKFNFGLGRNVPINYGDWTSSTTKVIPVQYRSIATNPPRRLYNKSDNQSDFTSSFSRRSDENSMRRENRLSSSDWPPKQEPATRKRSSMTIFIRQPYIDQCDVPYYRQTLPTQNYPQSARTDYY